MAEPIEKFTIRAGTEQDIPLILAFRKRLFQETGVTADALLPDVDTILNDLYHKEYSAGTMRHYIAYTEENVPAAVAGGLIKTDFPYHLFHPGYYGWIVDVYTLPEYRGRKLATKLLEHTNQWLKEKGVYEAKLIAAGSEARRLYERIGFRPTWEMSLNLSGAKTYNEFIDARKS